MRRKYIIIILILVFIFAFNSHYVDYFTGEKAARGELSSYFPNKQGIYYSYRGEGNEYASFKRDIKHVEGPYVQIHDNNGGTIMASVYKVDENQVGLLLERGEYYGSESLIEEAKKSNIKEIILKLPLQQGNSWETNDKRREIVATGVRVTVPAGTFYNVIKIKISSNNNDYIGYEFYAPNIGLIKEEHIGEGYQVKSELDAYRLETNNNGISEKVNIKLIAYYYEHLVRSIFQSAYESYINLDNLGDNNVEDFNQVIDKMKDSLAPIATSNVIHKQILDLMQIYRGGEGELTFPTHEVIKNSRIVEQDNNKTVVEFAVQRYYPGREWSGEAYNETLTYTVELKFIEGKWKVDAII